MPPPPAPSEHDARDAPLPRSQVRTACAVVGCLSLVVIAAVAALVYIVLTILGEFTPQPSGTEKDKEKKKVVSARPAPVAPTALVPNRGVFPLPATFDAVGRAANGRFLLLRIPFKAEVAVFDPVEAKVVKTFPLGEKNALFAGGAGKLFVYRPKAKELDQYDLLTGEKDETAKKPDAMAAVDQLVVGAAVDEPVLAMTAVGQGTQVAVIDPAPSAWALHTPREWNLPGDRAHVRASGTGGVLGVASSADAVPVPGVVFRFTPPKGFASGAFAGTKSVAHLTPAPDGRHVYSARGVFSPDGKPVLRPDGDHFYTLPTAHGSDLFLSVGVDDAGKFEAPLRLHLAGQRTPVAAIDRVRLPTGLDASDASAVPMDQRIHLWPAAGLLAVLPTSNAAIEMYPVDVPALLKKSGKDHFLFGSEPPTCVTRGEKLVYEPKVWSAPTGPVTFEVSGPEGMTMRGPVLMWTVPESGFDREVAATLRARHADGRIAEQAFRVLVLDSPQTP